MYGYVGGLEPHYFFSPGFALAIVMLFYDAKSNNMEKDVILLKIIMYTWLYYFWQ